MELYLTFHKVLDKLQEYQEQNPALNSFGYGNLIDFGKNVSGQTVQYPLLFVVPQSIQYDENTTTYQLSVIIADRLNETLDNEKDAISDCSIIARNLLSVIKRGFLQDFYETALPAQALPFIERFNDNVAGVALDLSLITYEDINACVDYPSPTPTPSQPNLTPTPTITQTETPTQTPTQTNTPSTTPTLTPTPTVTPIPCFEVGVGFSVNPTVIPILPESSAVMIGGIFTTYNGHTTSRVMRIYNNGSPDTSFVGLVSNQSVSSIIKDSSNRYVIAGNFTSYASVGYNRIVRIDSTGNIDPTFVIGTGFNATPNLLQQSDGKIICYGTFITYSGVSANRIIRLNTDGSIDNSFTTGTGFNGSVTSGFIQPDGKILLGGAFTTYSGASVPRLIRLNTDGTRDTSFNTGGSGPSDQVTTIVLDSLGRIYISGFFATYNGITTTFIARLNSDGTRDNTFDTANGLNATISRMIVDTNNKPVIVGQFRSYKGKIADNILRLNLDGSIDTTFDTGTAVNGDMGSLAQLSNGNYIMWGSNVTVYKDQTVNRLFSLDQFANLVDCP